MQKGVYRWDLPKLSGKHLNQIKITFNLPSYSPLPKVYM